MVPGQLAGLRDRTHRCPEVKPYDVWGQEQHRYNERDLCIRYNHWWVSSRNGLEQGSGLLEILRRSVPLPCSIPLSFSLWNDWLSFRTPSHSIRQTLKGVLTRATGRTIDADFKTRQADAAIGTAYDTPDTYMRVYYIGSGVMEHFATPEGSWDPDWSRMLPSEVPDTPGGAVAGLAWANTEVRVYYMAGEVIHEIGLTEGRGWWSVGHIQ